MPDLVAAGLRKTSLIDFPGRLSCVIFLTGCNFTCPYCHNPELAAGRYPQRIPLAQVEAFLAGRRSLLDGVVISGGEPTLQADLATWCTMARDLGLAVKLDTNGSRPKILKSLIRSDLLDYIAMDLKTAPECYGPPLCPEDAGPQVLKSIDLIKTCGVEYEFRSTCAAPFVDEARIKAMARAVSGARRLILQQGRPERTLDPSYSRNRHLFVSPEKMQTLQQMAAPFVQSCTIR